MPRTSTKTATSETVVKRSMQLVVKYQEAGASTGLVIDNGGKLVAFSVRETVKGGEGKEDSFVDHTVNLSPETVKRMIATLRKML